MVKNQAHARKDEKGEKLTISLTKDEVELLCKVLEGVAERVNIFDKGNKAANSTLSIYKKLNELFKIGSNAQ